MELNWIIPFKYTAESMGIYSMDACDFSNESQWDGTYSRPYGLIGLYRWY